MKNIVRTGRKAWQVDAATYSRVNVTSSYARQCFSAMCTHTHQKERNFPTTLARAFNRSLLSEKRRKWEKNRAQIRMKKKIRMRARDSARAGETFCVWWLASSTRHKNASELSREMTSVDRRVDIGFGTVTYIFRTTLFLLALCHEKQKKKTILSTFLLHPKFLPFCFVCWSSMQARGTSPIFTFHDTFSLSFPITWEKKIN